MVGVPGTDETLLVTGAAGFIGSHYVRAALERGCRVVSLDKLSYAADLRRLGAHRGDPRHAFVEGAIEDRALVADLLARHRPGAIVHFAAESHVDRSIDGPRAFLDANTAGTFTLLQAAHAYWRDLPDGAGKDGFRVLHISTDEVYGPADGPPFPEDAPFRPTSPYAASKAAAEHFVSSFSATYGLPVLIARPANSFGPWQFPEKLIPLTLARALDGEKLAVYGDGRQEREWLHVGDHCAGVDAVLRHGRPGRAYNLAGVESRTNIEVVEALCRLLDESRPRADGRPYHNQIAFVADRPGHDRRYAIDPARAAAELGWRPATGFDDGLAATVDWYLENETWWRDIRATRYAGERLGVGR